MDLRSSVAGSHGLPVFLTMKQLATRRRRRRRRRSENVCVYSSATLLKPLYLSRFTKISDRIQQMFMKQLICTVVLDIVLYVGGMFTVTGIYYRG